MTITKEEIGEVVKATIEGMNSNRPTLAEPSFTDEQKKQSGLRQILNALQSLDTTWHPHPTVIQAQGYLLNLIKEM